MDNKKLKKYIIITVCIVVAIFILVRGVLFFSFLGFYPKRQTITKYAISTNSVWLCNFVGSTDNVDGWPAALPGDCYADYAAAKKDISLCKKWRDAHPADLLFDDAKCYIDASKNPEADYIHCKDIVTDPGYQSEDVQRFYCYINFAVKTNNPAICENIQQGSAQKDMCVLQRVLNKDSYTKNETFYKNYCAKVTDPSSIYLCNKYINPSGELDVSSWKSYSWSGLTFKYPADWSVSDLKSNGISSPGLYFEPGGFNNNDQILVNRVACGDTGSNETKCVNVGGFPIFTSSKDENTLTIFDLFVQNIKGQNGSRVQIQNNSNQTAELQTYTSTEYSFSFQYPQNITVSTKDYPPAPSVLPFNIPPIAYFKISDDAKQTEGYMSVSASNNVNDVANCTAYAQNRIDNGNGFFQYNLGNGGVDGFRQDIKTIKNNYCFDIEISAFPSACVNSGCDNRLWSKQTILDMFNRFLPYNNTFQFTK